MNISPKQMAAIVEDMAFGMAKLQARQHMLECVVRALIVESPPAHPLFWKALHTAKSDLDHRSTAARPENPPEVDGAALALWNELCAACAPPAAAGQQQPGP